MRGDLARLSRAWGMKKMSLPMGKEGFTDVSCADVLLVLGLHVYGDPRRDVVVEVLSPAGGRGRLWICYLEVIK